MFCQNGYNKQEVIQVITRKGEEPRVSEEEEEEEVEVVAVLPNCSTVAG